MSKIVFPHRIWSRQARKSIQNWLSQLCHNWHLGLENSLFGGCPGCCRILGNTRVGLYSLDASSSPQVVTIKTVFSSSQYSLGEREHRHCWLRTFDRETHIMNNELNNNLVGEDSRWLPDFPRECWGLELNGTQSVKDELNECNSVFFNHVYLAVTNLLP